MIIKNYLSRNRWRQVSQRVTLYDRHCLFSRSLAAAAPSLHFYLFPCLTNIHTRIHSVSLEWCVYQYGVFHTKSTILRFSLTGIWPARFYISLYNLSTHDVSLFSRFCVWQLRFLKRYRNIVNIEQFWMILKNFNISQQIQNIEEYLSLLMSILVSSIDKLIRINKENDFMIFETFTSFVDTFSNDEIWRCSVEYIFKNYSAPSLGSRE